MVRSRSLMVGKKEFASKAEATEYFSVILNRYDVNTRVTSADDAADLVALLARHPRRADKEGAGIDHFEVRHRATQPYRENSKCFWVVRRDGTEDTFSIKTCLNPV